MGNILCIFLTRVLNNSLECFSQSSKAVFTRLRLRMDQSLLEVLSKSIVIRCIYPRNLRLQDRMRTRVQQTIPNVVMSLKYEIDQWTAENVLFPRDMQTVNLFTESIPLCHTCPEDKRCKATNKRCNIIV